MCIAPRGPHRLAVALLAVVCSRVAAEGVPRAVVINLRRNPERYAGVKAALEAEDLEFDRLDAVDGRALTATERSENVTALGRALMTPGMIGCFLSHRKCWELCLHLRQPVIVFEDDVMVSSDFKAKLTAAMKNLPADWDVLLLGSIGAISPKYYHVNFFHALAAGGMRWPRWHAEDVHEPLRAFGTHAYMVSEKGAAELLRRCPRVNYHVDVVAWGLRGLRLFAIHPLLAKQTHEDTTIGGKDDRSFLPQFVIDPYTGADFAWAWNAPLFKVGGERGLLLTTGRLASMGVVGFLAAAVLQSMGLVKLTVSYIVTVMVTVQLMVFQRPLQPRPDYAQAHAPSVEAGPAPGPAPGLEPAETAHLGEAEASPAFEAEASPAFEAEASPAFEAEASPTFEAAHSA